MVIIVQLCADFSAVKEANPSARWADSTSTNLRALEPGHPTSNIQV